MPIVTFSDTLLQKLPTGRIQVLRDRVMCGLCVRVGRRTKTFFIATSVRGKQLRLTIGRWPLVTVHEARQLAAPLLIQCRQGITPSRKTTRLAEPTLGALLPSYVTAKKLRPSSATRYASLLRTHFSEWLDEPVSKLATERFHQHCALFASTTGAAVVDIARGMFSALVAYANATQGSNISSPFKALSAAGLLPAPALPRSLQLTAHRLSSWRCSVDKLPELQRDYLLLVALTGLRRNECADITAADVNFELSVLSIPHTKNGKPHTLPLTPAIEPILRRRVAPVSGSGRLFEGMSADHIAQMAMRHGAPKFSLHDLRKLIVTEAEHLGISDTVKRRILNHAAARGDTLNRHYVTLSVDQIRLPLERVQSRLLDLMTPVPGATGFAEE